MAAQKIGLYLMNLKGYRSLAAILDQYPADVIAFCAECVRPPGV